MKKRKKKSNKKGNGLNIVLGILLLGWDLLNENKVHRKKRNKILEQMPKEMPQKKIVSMSEQEKREEDVRKIREGWTKAQPEKLPPPTYWPFFLAVGLVLLFWGIITGWILFLVGLLIFIISLRGWINILRHEK